VYIYKFSNASEQKKIKKKDTRKKNGKIKCSKNRNEKINMRNEK
jgi:hypothetical protein